MSGFHYLAAAQLSDGSETTIDLEERGWADKELLARTVRWTLIPKEGATTMHGRPYPIVTVAIPDGGRPVFKSRVYGVIAAVSSDSTVLFRAYAIGYKHRGETHLSWVLPTGDIELTTQDELYFGDLLLKRIKSAPTQE